MFPTSSILSYVPRHLLQALLGIVILAAGESSLVAQIVLGNNGNTLILNSDASQDLDGDNRFEDLSGVSGVEFLLDQTNGNNLRVTSTSSLPGISGAYQFVGSVGTLGTGEAGMQMVDVGTTATQSFQTLNYNPTDNDASNERMTLELWFKPNDLTGTEVLWEDGGGTGMGLFLNGNNLELRKVPGSGLVASFDMSSLVGGGTGEFTQAVVQFNPGPNPDTVSLYVNGEVIAANVTSGNNGNDWSGGDPFGLGPLGGANMGGIGGGPSGQSAFEGEIAIFRAYRNDLLTDQQIMRNYSLVSGQVVAGQNISFFTGATGTTWNNSASWDTGVLPVSTDSMTVINNGNTVEVSDLALVAHTLLVGSDINGAGAAAGAGTLNVTGGDLTVTTNLNLGGAGAGNVGTVDNSAGTLIVAGDLNLDVLGSANTANQFTNSGGVTTIGGNIVFDPTNMIVGGGNGGGGTVSVTGGTLNAGSTLVSPNGTGVLDISAGEFVFTDGKVDQRNVQTLNLTSTGDLQFTLARATGFTPLTVIGTATTADTATITVDTAANPVAAPLAETVASNGITWVAANPINWSSGAPDGTAAFQTGATVDLLLAGSLVGTTPVSGNLDWTISVDDGDPNKLIATRTGADLNLGPVHAVIDASSGTVTRNAAIVIAEAPSSVGASASRLSVRDTGVLNVNTDLIIGNVGGAGLVTVGTAGGASTPDLNVAGNVQFGTAAGDFGGELAIDEGTADITGNIVKADPGVGDSTVSLSGGALTFNNLIDVDFFNLGAKQDQAGTFTLNAGQTINASQRMTIGALGEGDFVNDGATVTAGQIVIGGADNAVNEGSADNSSFTQNSGTTTVNGYVHLGDDAINGADGSFLNIIGGTFSVGGGLRAAHSVSSGEGGNPAVITVGDTFGSDPTLIVSGGNLETAENAAGVLNLLSGTIFLENNNLIIGQGGASNSDTNLNGGVFDMRGTSGTNTGSDINFNTGVGTLTIDGADLYVARNINMGSHTTNGQGRTNRLELNSGNLFVRNDINTRTNGTGASGNKIDVISITGGNLIFGEGFATGADGAEGSAINFEASPGATVTFNVFDWFGGTIRGLDAVTGIANITGSDEAAPGTVGDAGVFRQKGGTFVLEAGTTTFDGNVAIDGGAIWQVSFTADDALTVTPNPNPNRAAFIDVDGDLATASAGGETFTFGDFAQFDLRASGGAGDTTGANAVTFDADSSLTWDGTSANWNTDILPSVAASGQVADVGAQFVIAESSEASINTIPANLQIIGDTDWTLSLGTNDQGGALAITNNQLIATRINNPLDGEAAALAIINGGAGGIVQRNTDLLISAAANGGADAAALQIDAQGLDVTGSSNLIIGSGATGQAGESFVNQNGGAVTIGGDLVFGSVSGANGGEYNLTGGTLAVTGGVVVNTVGENADINFDGGSATFGGGVNVEDLGIGRKAGSVGVLTLAGQTIGISDDLIVGDEGTANGTATVGAGAVLNVGDDVIVGNQANSTGMLSVVGDGNIAGADDLLVGADGTGVATFGDNTAGGQPTLSFNRADVGLNTGGDGTLNILNGTYTGTGGMVVATNAGAVGALVIGDGTVDSNPVVTITGGNTETANGGVGTVTINSGTYNQNSNNVIVGQVDGSDATLNINGGAMNISGQLRISNGGKGVVNLAGGILTVNNTLDMGNNGLNDGGTLNVSGTGLLQLNGQLIIANNASQDATSDVFISGGEVNVTGNTTVGAAGEGSLSITGGGGTGVEHDLSGIFIVGSANNAVSKGTVTIDLVDPGDTVNTGQVRLGANGQAQMDLIEGTMNVTSSFNVAYSANSSAANSRISTFTLGDGTSTPTLNVTGGNFEAALAGTGVTTIKSGTYNQNTSNLIIGQNGGSNASVVVENGDVNIAGAGIIRIGNQDASTGSFEIQNGTVDSGSIDFGANIAGLGASTNAGTYTQSGGTVTTGAFTVANGGNTIAVSGGSLSVSTINLDNDPADVGSTFHFTGGSVTTSGALDYRAGFSDISISQLADVNIGGNLNFDGGGTTLNPNTFSVVGGTATIDIGGDFSMNGMDQRMLTFEALSASATPVSVLNVLGDVSVGGTLELIGFDLLDWTTVFGGGSGTVTLINNQSANGVTGTFQQTDGFVWGEGGAWVQDSQWSLSYLGGTGNDVVLNYTAMIIPEPSRMVMLGFGVIGILMRRRRK